MHPGGSSPAVGLRGTGSLAFVRCTQRETHQHKYDECSEVRRFWGHVLAVWERIAGERLSPTDPWVTRWGVRLHTWWDPVMAASYGGEHREAVFRTLHVAAVSTRFTMRANRRDRDWRVPCFWPGSGWSKACWKISTS